MDDDTMIPQQIVLTLLGTTLGIPIDPLNTACREQAELLHRGGDAADHFSPKSNTTAYTVEITRNYLTFQTEGCKPLKVRLTQQESEGIQKLSLEFIKLLDSSKLSGQEEAEVLDWKDLNPIIVLTNSAFSIRFVKKVEPSDSDYDGNERFIFWKFLTQFATNVFEKKLNEANVTLEEENSFEGNGNGDMQTFLHTLWKIMKVSINYAEDNFKGWTTSSAPEVNEGPTKQEKTPVGSEEQQPSKKLIRSVYHN
ncbi:hypothetical protein RUM43_011131 [Polyplax serrata]|uniref:Uncharacterized protein n=1 Tax=Polyplax serrata TaxID=468196 RepID=A0AAN8RZZ4_POLSC